MARDTVDLIEHTVNETNRWLHEIDVELGWGDRRAALHALRGVLHLIRDRAPLDESAQFSAQLPTLVRGLYWERWDPSRTLLKERDQSVLLSRIVEEFGDDERALNPAEIARAVFTVIHRHLSSGEVENVRHTFPRSLQELWPTVWPT